MKKFNNFRKISQQFAFFVQTRKNVTNGKAGFLKKNLTNAFLAIFWTKFLKIFENFLKNFLQIAFSSKFAKLEPMPC